MIVLAVKLRRLRAAQRTILGGEETDLAAHAASLQEAFVQLRDWVEEVAAGLEGRVAGHRAARGRLRSPTPPSSATTP